jgi:hypothetical protein
MEFAKQKATADYIGQTERVMRELESLCGSKERANELLDDIAIHYKNTSRELSTLESRHGGKGSEAYDRDKGFLLSIRRSELDRIIERYAPHATDKTKDLVIAASFAAIALTLPLAASASLLATATSLIAIGASYFASFHVLRHWPALVSKAKIHEAFAQGAIVPKAAPIRKVVSGKAQAKGKK